MKTAALLVSLVAIVAGVVGLVAPESLLTLGRSVTTPLGLAVIGSVRIVIGLILMGSAPDSSMPRTLRVVGALVAAAGLATPLVGVDRTRAILDWEAAQGPSFIRAVASLVLAIGGLIAFAVRPKRRSLNPEP
jgi:hypothetical protein